MSPCTHARDAQDLVRYGHRHRRKHEQHQGLWDGRESRKEGETDRAGKGFVIGRQRRKPIARVKLGEHGAYGASIRVRIRMFRAFARDFESVFISE